MESHTQIIELFGVPACGKSTIAEYIVENKKLYNVGTKTNMYTEFDNSCFVNKFRSFRLSSFINGVSFLNYFPKEEKRKNLSYFQFLKAAWCRNYQKMYGKYSMIISDHGIIQDFVTWERGDNYNSDPVFEKKVLNYLHNERDVCFVFCDIDTNIAFERLSIRGRSTGRLDEMLNNERRLLLCELNDERNRFVKLYKLLKTNNFKVASINTSYTVEQNVNTLIDAVNNFKHEPL